jgi:hypothetical protein
MLPLFLSLSLSLPRISPSPPPTKHTHTRTHVPWLSTDCDRDNAIYHHYEHEYYTDTQTRTIYHGLCTQNWSTITLFKAWQHIPSSKFFNIHPSLHRTQHCKLASSHLTANTHTHTYMYMYMYVPLKKTVNALYKSMYARLLPHPKTDDAVLVYAYTCTCTKRTIITATI